MRKTGWPSNPQERKSLAKRLRQKRAFLMLNYPGVYRAWRAVIVRNDGGRNG